MTDETIRQRMHDKVDNMMDKAESMGDRGMAMRRNVDGFVRKNPEKTVLIAAGIGAVIGVVLTAAIMRNKD